MSIWDQFTPEAGQKRRRWLNEQADGLLTYVPPELRPWLGLANELNPVTSMERAGASAKRVADPSLSGWERMAAVGDTASNMAAVVAPMIGASRAGLPVANAIEEGLLGFSPAVQPFLLDESGALRAFHGSPHDFDRFEWSPRTRGTGEGAQAFGDGLYFAESEDVARGYRDALAPGMGDGALRAVGVSDSDLRTMRQFTQSAVDPEIALRDWLGWTGKRETPELRSAFMQEWDGRNPGRMYEVQINANPEDFLDWFKPLKEQSDKINMIVGDRLEKFLALDGPQLQGPYDRFISGDMTGDEAYRLMSPQAGIDKINWSKGIQEQASENLLRAGVPGIRFLDFGSRGAGAGSSNYVVFDDRLIEIVRKYGIAGAAALYGVSAADIDAAMAQEQPRGLLNQ